MLELDTVVAKITSVFPKKEGKKDDSPLAIIIKFDLDLRASDVLPQFHPTLNSFIYDERGVRFAGLGSFSWHETHSNMEIEIQDLVLPASKIGKYHITPYTTPTEDDPDLKNRLWLSCEAKIVIGNVAPSPLNILSEMINTSVEMSIRPSQLLLLEIAQEKKVDVPLPLPRKATAEEQVLIKDVLTADNLVTLKTTKRKK